MSSDSKRSGALYLAEQLERLACQVYTRLARIFREQENARRSFEQLAAEEEQHALRVVMLQRQLRTNPKLYAGIDLDGAELERLLRQTESMLEHLAGLEGHLSLEAARRLAVDLEERFASAHAHVMAQSGDPRIRSFFEMLARQDREHLALLGRLV